MKSLTLWWGVFALLLLFQPAAAQTTLPLQDDRQFWNETQIIKPLGKQQDLMIITALRIGRGFERPVDERIGVGVAFKLNQYFTVMPTYFYIDQQPYAGRRISEHRLIANVTGKLKLGEVTFTDRNLIERRVRNNTPDFTVYRNRLQIDHPAHLGEFHFKPFIADEIWYSTQTVNGHELGLFRNRIAVGIIKDINKHFNAEFFYLYQNDGISQPGDVHALGTLFRVKLD